MASGRWEQKKHRARRPRGSSKSARQSSELGGVGTNVKIYIYRK